RHRPSNERKCAGWPNLAHRRGNLKVPNPETDSTIDPGSRRRLELIAHQNRHGDRREQSPFAELDQVPIIEDFGQNKDQREVDEESPVTIKNHRRRNIQESELRNTQKNPGPGLKEKKSNEPMGRKKVVFD